MANIQQKVVILDYCELQDKDLSSSIECAFGQNGLGICLVKNVPDLMRLRKRLLILASTFAALPDDVKERYVHPQSTYSFGWSHGKEKMNGKLDFAKGSYYNNPMQEHPSINSKEFAEKYPYYAYANIWPTEIPDMQPAFMELGKLIVKVGLLISKQCDIFIKRSHPDTRDDFMHGIIQKSQTCKARLLHYFPMDSNIVDSSIDSWCGLHVDHSMVSNLRSNLQLTGLTSAMYIDECKENHELNPNLVSPNTGLYIQDQQGNYIQVDIPADCLAFQMGEAAQVASNGVLKATPHLVRGMASRNIARNTFAVFMQPNVDEMLTKDMSYYQFSQQVFARHY